MPPADMTPEERERELARLFATALLRLRWPAISAGRDPVTKLSNSETNELARSGDASVTVHAG